MRLLRAAAAIGLFALGGCRGDAATPPAPEALPLDQPLEAGQVRAGIMRRSEELLSGPTAKGRAGDLKLYNSRIAVVISQLGAARGYVPYGGTILDADRVRPAGEPGQTTFGQLITSFDLSVIAPRSIEVVADGRDGKPAIIRSVGSLGDFPLLSALVEALTTGRTQKPIEVTVDYILAPDRDWLEVETRLANLGDTDADVALPAEAFLFGDGALPFIPGFGFAPPSSGFESDFYGAIAENVSYVFGRVGRPLNFIIGQSGLLLAGAGDEFTLRAHDEVVFRDQLLVGDGDLSRTQALWRALQQQAPGVVRRGRVLSQSGQPIARARVHVTHGVESDRDYVTMTRTDAEGRFAFEAPAGALHLRVATDALLPSVVVPIAADQTDIAVTLPDVARLGYRITDAAGSPLPSKLTLILEGNDPNGLPRKFGEPDQPSGVLRMEHAIRGEGSLELPPGSYRVWASRGTEYEVVAGTFEAISGQETRFEAQLVRSVDTRGWQSTDTHVHAQLSPDSPDLYPFKVSAMVTEGLELPVSTEHEAIGDFNPAIAQLGLGRWIKGIVGTEVTTFTYGHFNAFPLLADPLLPGNGRIDWIGKAPPATFATVRARPEHPFFQVNHPRSASIGGYFSAKGFDRERFSASAPDWSFDFDGFEVANGCNVARIEQEEMLDWFAFLNHGMRKVGTGSTDNHYAGRGGMGYPKTFVRLGGDEPSEVAPADFRAAFLAGRLSVSCGPFVDMKIGSAQIGDLVALSGDLVRVEARVAAPTWVDVDQIELIVDGTVRKTVAIGAGRVAERFAGVITASVTPGRDAWVIVRVRGNEREGPWAFGTLPWAFTNPIFVDGNGDQSWTMTE